MMLLPLFSGCGPSRVLPDPPGLPKQLGGRTLWHTPVGYIYAAEEAVAGETERWMSALDGHLRRTYQRPLGKGLVVVNDSDGPPCIDVFDEIVRLQSWMAQRMAVPEDQRPTLAEHRERLAESAMSEELACAVFPVALDDAALARLALAPGIPDDVQWSMCCPSHRLMRVATWEFAPAAIEKKKGKAFALATAWALPLAVPEAAKAFRLRRDLLAFEAWCVRQDDWPAEKRTTQCGRYQKERAFLISPTLALALTMAQDQQSTAPGR